MHRIRCAEIWGGIGSHDEDVCSGGIFASLHSSAYGGPKGGDIYYLSVCGIDSLTRIAIADVAGHGAQVADVSQWLYDILETHMNDPGCDQILTELNDCAVKYGIRALTTAAVVGFYTKDSNLYFSYAGHPPALLQRAGSTDWLPLEIDAGSTCHLNSPLGVIPESDFDQRHLALTTGDRVFLHTDGLTEAMNESRESFGEERLQEALKQASGESLANVKQSVLAAVDRHIGNLSVQDDVTLLALEIR